MNKTRFISLLVMLCSTDFTTSVDSRYHLAEVIVPRSKHADQQDREALQRVRSYLDRLDRHVESTQETILMVIERLNTANAAEMVQIETEDAHGVLIWTSNGFYVSLSVVLLLHLMVLITFGLIMLCFPTISTDQRRLQPNLAV